MPAALDAMRSDCRLLASSADGPARAAQAG
jgi:hypothetical protein